MKTKNKSKLSKQVEVGQNMYGVWSGLAWSTRNRDHEENPHIDKFIVTDVNNSSFYVHEIEQPEKYQVTRRVSRKTWQTKDAFGARLALYETEQEILDRATLVKESRELSEWLQQRITQLSIEQKRKLKEQLDES